jgi:sarcosine oxidase
MSVSFDVIGFDVIVIGLGGMGSAAAYQLAKRGQRVLGLEQYTAPHNRGSSHGKSRIIRQAYFEHPDYVPLLMRAYELWQQIEQDSQYPLLHLTGGLMLGLADSPTITGSLRSAQTHGLAHEVLTAAEIHQRFPVLHPSPETIGLYEDQAGYVCPEVSIQAYLKCATQLGAELHFEEPVLDWQADSAGVKVTTAEGDYWADKLVITPGAWASQLFKLDLSLVVERQVLYWFEPTQQLSEFEQLPIYIWETENGVYFYGFPTQGTNQGIKVALLDHGQVCTPETIDRQVHDYEIAKMRMYLAQYIPALNGRCLEAITCMYTNTFDGHFAIGLHPKYPQVTLASPCSGHGFKFASVMGEVLADLAIQGKTRHGLGLFGLERFFKSPNKAADHATSGNFCRHPVDPK